jgi:predicted nucleotidyltransferase component of viral defense system
MMGQYSCCTSDDYVNALREILQELALLGLWRSKFFEHAAFYGGTALRILYGLNRYSEDLDFSLLRPDRTFSLGAYGSALQREIRAFGFNVVFEPRQKKQESQIESAFLKTNTCKELIIIDAAEEALRDLHPAKNLKIKLEVDTDPPGGFETEMKHVLRPMPFSVRTCCLPDLFAGKLHAVLCRKWQARVKGRDWYDLVWYLGHYPEVRLAHLEARMRQSGDYPEERPLDLAGLKILLRGAIERLDVEHARSEVRPFLADHSAVDVWSREFFAEIIDRIVAVP